MDSLSWNIPFNWMSSYVIICHEKMGEFRTPAFFVDVLIEKMMADVHILLEMMVDVRLAMYWNSARLTWQSEGYKPPKFR